MMPTPYEKNSLPESVTSYVNARKYFKHEKEGGKGELCVGG